MNEKSVKLQKRFVRTAKYGSHPVYQIQVPVSLVDKLCWEKGDVILLKLTNKAGNLSLSLSKQRLKSGGK